MSSLKLTAYEDMKYFSEQEDLVQVLINKTQNDNPLFFRILVAYTFSKIASMMRVNIDTKDRGVIPINTYAINLSVSGSGKGFSTNIIEERVINKFRHAFIQDTFPILAEEHIELLARNLSASKNIPIEEAEVALKKEFESLGPLVFGFDSGTVPAIKQMRHKLLMAHAGSINLEIDEIGSNLVGNIEVLNTFLELYDVGKVKQKLIKNTKENQRNEEIEGKTPTNMMLYGTPMKLLNGSKTEEEFYSMLETGYARRSLFGYSKKVNKQKEMTPLEAYDMLTNTDSDKILDDLSFKLLKLADMIHFGRNIKMTKDITIKLITYKLICEREAALLPEFDEIRKAELEHRYYKTLKLAGTYAFIAGHKEVEESDLFAAIKLVEDSGKAFEQILSRPRIHERIATYLAEARIEVTQVDLMEDLPFYRGTAAQRKDILTQAIAWGYKNNIIIKTSYSDGIEFFKGEALEKTDLKNIQIAASTDIVLNYEPLLVAWVELYKLITAPSYEYTAHLFKDRYRSSANLIPGFNLVILDVDSGTTLKIAKALLKDYTALFVTTKSHTKEHNRFRIILPLSHTLKLTLLNYSRFMSNIFDWLPFGVDVATKDCARKWSSHPGDYEYTSGILLDAMMFIPDTNKQAKQRQLINDNIALSNLERWFLLNTSTGNRSNTLIRYALALVDGGLAYDAIRASVLSFNSKLEKPLTEAEIDSTILVTAMKKIVERDSIS